MGSFTLDYISYQCYLGKDFAVMLFEGIFFRSLASSLLITDQNLCVNCVYMSIYKSNWMDMNLVCKCVAVLNYRIQYQENQCCLSEKETKSIILSYSSHYNTINISCSSSILYLCLDFFCSSRWESQTPQKPVSSFAHVSELSGWIIRAVRAGIWSPMLHQNEWAEDY